MPFGAALAGQLAAHSVTLLLATAAATQAVALAAFALTSGDRPQDSPPPSARTGPA